MSNKYKNIAIPINLEHDSSWRIALPDAIEYARAHNATLHLLTVVPHVDIPAIAIHLPDDMDRHVRQEGLAAIGEFIAQHIPDDIVAKAHVGQGKVHKEVLRLATSIKADLVVMASHRPDLEDYLISANAAYVMRHAACSVLIVRQPTGGK